MRRREVGIGASIQRSMLGELPEGIEGAQLAGYADPSQIIDGDFYTVRRYRPDCFEVLMGDVMGKGVEAALMGAGIIAAYNRALADLLVAEAGVRSLPTPAEIVNAIHRALTPQMITLSSFATLALYRFYLDAGTLVYVNAGHTPGLLTRGPDARPVAILGENLPIGVMPDEVYVQFSLTVGPGDSLLLFSDGITEARNAAGEEFGIERLCGLLEPGSMADLPPATMLHALRGEQRRFNGGGPGTDDLTA
ncbi:MAG: PP2C family protein-serine/threonine phosphatase, partial [Proteobacteria bacterium]|nr:PP2C family protein-serine/threonine phosphatase [Pseudomonadota bacterium]